MDIKQWDVAVLASNKFEAKLVADLLKNAGVVRIRVMGDRLTALEALHHHPTNIIVASGAPFDDLEWVRQLRRDASSQSRKAPLFMMSAALTAALAESCRQAGVNAVIGKPVSSAIILKTVKKVLARPRPFIESECYVGPCRRAGIVTAGAGKLRRRADRAA